MRCWEEYQDLCGTLDTQLLCMSVFYIVGRADRFTSHTTTLMKL